MQRTNLWPNPCFDPKGYHESVTGTNISNLFVNNTFANTTNKDIDLPFSSVLDDDVDYVCRVNVVRPASNMRALAVFGVNGGDGFVTSTESGVTGVKTFRFRKGKNTRLAVLAGMTVSDLLVERADTYDGVGGASKLLYGRHDATSVGATIGRVMPDDGNEPDKQSKSPHHAGTGRVHADFDHREDSGYHILVHGLAGRVGRLRHDRQLSGHLQQEPTHRMVLHVPDRESDEPEIQGRVRQSDRQGVEPGHVRAGRIPGEQSLARRPLLFRRGYDAARLTPMGVVA